MVNVIIPIYHSKKTLPNCLGSLLIQTFKDFFVTLVQDGDGEDYTELIEEYRRRGLDIRLLSLEENVGPGLARQAGMDADNESEYFMLCDSDDMVMPAAIEALHRGMVNEKLDIISSSFVRHEPDTNLLQDVRNTAITWCAGKIYRAKYLKECNIRFHPQLRLNEDSYFNVVAWNATKKRGQLHEITVLMMDNPDSLTRKDGLKGFFEKGWEQYILSQADGLREIFKQTLYMNPAIAARTLVYLYNECMIALRFDMDTSKAKEYLKKLDVQWMHECIGTMEFWREIENSCKGINFFANEIVFPKISFDKWLEWWLTKPQQQEVKPQEAPAQEEQK